MSITDGLQRSIENGVALHYTNAPDHAAKIVRNLLGSVESLSSVKQDDPLLYAYEIHDRLAKIAGYILLLDKWAVAVIDATPDQIQETGAQ